MKYLPWLGIVLGLVIWLGAFYYLDDEVLRLVFSLTGSFIFTLGGLKPLVERKWGR